MAVGALAACGSGASTTTAGAATTGSVAPSVAGASPAATVSRSASASAAAPTAAQPAGKKSVVSFELWDNNHFDVEQQMLDAFQQATPNITISVRHTVSNYLTKIQTELAGNAAPDVFWLSTSFFPAMATNGTLVNLSPLVARDKVAMNAYGPAYVQYYTYQSKLLGFPKDWDTVALLYNKDLFDAAGIPYPTDAWKWSPTGADDILTTAQQLTKGSGPNRQYGIVSSTAGQTFWWNFVWMNGGDILDAPWGKKVTLGTPEAMAAIQWGADLANKYQVSPTIKDLSGMSADQTFWTGHAAMITNGDWVIHNYQKQIGTRFKWDIAPLPTGPKGRISETNSLAYGLWSGSKNQDDAWTFIRWLGKEGEVLLAKGGAVFPAYLPAVDDFVKSIPSLNMQAFADERATAHPVPETPYSNELNNALNSEMQAVWGGTETVQVAAQHLSDKLDPVLANTPAR